MSGLKYLVIANFYETQGTNISFVVFIMFASRYGRVLLLHCKLRKHK